MSSILLFNEYLRWHYEESLRQFWEIWKDFLWFGYHFFSIPLLVRTLFSPIYRIKETYDWRHLRLELIFQSMAVNVVARVIGFLLRIIVIALGIIFELVVLFMGPALFLIWATLPALALGLMGVGLVLLL